MSIQGTTVEKLRPAAARMLAHFAAQSQKLPGGVVTISKRELAAVLKLAPKTVDLAMQQLVAKNFVQRHVNHAENGGQLASSYTVTSEGYAWLGATEQARAVQAKRRQQNQAKQANQGRGQPKTPQAGRGRGHPPAAP